MARTRYIKPGFFDDVKIAEFDMTTRLLYIGLWCFMDSQGALEHEPKIIKKNVFPYDDIKISKIESIIESLVSGGFLIKYQADDKSYLFCPKFSKHQKIHVGEPAKYPNPLDNINNTHLAPTLLGASFPLTLTNTLTKTIIKTITSEHGLSDQDKPDLVNLNFDFERLYQTYPLKRGKSLGMKQCIKQIKTQNDFDLLAKAVKNYANEVNLKRTKPEYIKHFSTFMNQWRDYLERDVHAPVAISFTDEINV